MNYEKMLREKQNDLTSKAEGILSKAKLEKRELTDDEAQELAEIRDDVKRIKETLGLKDDIKDMKEEEIKKVSDGGKTEIEIEKDRACDNEKRELQKREVEEAKAFEMFIRNTIKEGFNERAQNLTLGANGAVIPTTIAKKIITKVYDICPILEKSTKYNVKGNLDLPYYDESTGAITVAFTDDFNELTANVGNFTSIQLTGYLAGALALVGRRLINNAQFDIVNFVIDIMAKHIARFIENILLNGSTSANGTVDGLSKATNALTAASATAVTADELIQLQGQVKDVFQQGAIWIMSPNTRTALRQLKDNMGRYLLNDDMQATFGTKLLGKDVYVSDNMPDMAKGKVAIYYGDMSGLATKFSEDMEIQVLREKYATQHAVGIVGWLEFDSKIEDAQKIAVLKMAAQ